MTFLKQLDPIVLCVVGVIGVACVLTGVAMIYEPAWLIGLGLLLTLGAVALAYEKGRPA